jgi:membrane protein
MKGLIESVSKFLRETMWFERKETRKLVRFLVRILQVSFLVGRGFLDNKCFVRASALAFTTLLSIVPLLAFVFAILKGLGVEEQVRPYILERVAAAQDPVAEKLVTYISNYISSTRATALGVVGLVTLLYTVVKVLSTVESSFNDIWGVSRGRTWMRKVADYTSVMVIAPVLLVAAIGVSTYLLAFPLSGPESVVTAGRILARVLVRTGPYLMTWIAFTAFYAFMPNASVRFTAALSGGIAGGTLWQLAFWAYTKFQIGVARYDVVYTSFAALPVFMVWLYLCWVIALFGAEVAFAAGHVETYKRDLQRFSPSAEARERLALRVFLEAARRFHDGEKPLGDEGLSKATGLPLRAVSDTVTALLGAGILCEVKGDRQTLYHPSRDLSQTTPAMVFQAVRSQGDNASMTEDDPLWRETAKAADAFARALSAEELTKSIESILSRRR